MWSKLRSLSLKYNFSVAFCCTISNKSALLDLLPWNSRRLLVTSPRSLVAIIGDHNIHSREWLEHCCDTSFLGREAEQILVINSLSQLNDVATDVHDRTEDGAHELNHIPTSFLHFSNILFLADLADRTNVITLSISYPGRKPSPFSAYNILLYNSTDLDSVRCF